MAAVRAVHAAGQSRPYAQLDGVSAAQYSAADVGKIKATASVVFAGIPPAVASTLFQYDFSLEKRVVAAASARREARERARAEEERRAAAAAAAIAAEQEKRRIAAEVARTEAAEAQALAEAEKARAAAAVAAAGAKVLPTLPSTGVLLTPSVVAAGGRDSVWASSGIAVPRRPARAPAGGRSEYAEFENNGDNPFETAELQSINDLAELKALLGDGRGGVDPPHDGGHVSTRSEAVHGECNGINGVESDGDDSEEDDDAMGEFVGAEPSAAPDAKHRRRPTVKPRPYPPGSRGSSTSVDGDAPPPTLPPKSDTVRERAASLSRPPPLPPKTAFSYDGHVSQSPTAARASLSASGSGGRLQQGAPVTWPVGQPAAPKSHNPFEADAAMAAAMVPAHGYGTSGGIPDRSAAPPRPPKRMDAGGGGLATPDSFGSASFSAYSNTDPVHSSGAESWQQQQQQQPYHQQHSNHSVGRRSSGAAPAPAHAQAPAFSGASRHSTLPAVPSTVAGQQYPGRGDQSAGAGPSYPSVRPQYPSPFAGSQQARATGDPSFDSLVGMGFPSARVKKALDYGKRDQKKAIDFLVLYQEFSDQKYDGDSIETALHLFDLDADKARKFLASCVRLGELGFPPDRTREALLLADCDPDDALDLLVSNKV